MKNRKIGHRAQGIKTPPQGINPWAGKAVQSGLQEIDRPVTASRSVLPRLVSAPDDG